MKKLSKPRTYKVVHVLLGSALASITELRAHRQTLLIPCCIAFQRIFNAYANLNKLFFSKLVLRYTYNFITSFCKI